MPAVLQIGLWIAAGLTAVGVIYLKGIRPLAKFITETERTVPVLRDVTEKLRSPEIIDVIVEMAKQFQTNSGSSLRDVVNRLEVSINESNSVTEILRVTVEANHQAQEEDRAQIALLLEMLNHLQMQADANTGKVKPTVDQASELIAGIDRDKS